MREPALSPTSRRALRRLGAGGVLVLLVSWLLPAPALPAAPRGEQGPSFAVSPQDCTTECQSAQTDCILDCEGNVKCETDCTKVGLDCVERCRQSPPDAGAPR